MKRQSDTSHAPLATLRRVGDATPPGRDLLIALICSDVIFLVLHVVQAATGKLAYVLFSLEADRGYAEVFQYLKEFWLVILLGLYGARTRSALPFAWAAVFGYLLVDDSLMVHEVVGGRVAELLDLAPWRALRGKDFGELIVSGLAVALLVGPIVLTHRRAGERDRSLSRTLVMLVGVLAFFGVAVDMIHQAFIATTAAAVLAIVEDGGEMVTMSVIVIVVLRHTAGLDRAAGAWHN